MRSVRVRPAAAPDAGRIAEVHVDSWNAAYTGLIDQAELDRRDLDWRTAQWKDFFEGGKWPAHRTWVIEDDGRIEGFARVGPSEDDDVDPDKTVTVFALYLDPGARGRGLGTVLLDHVLERVRADGYEWATLYVLIENQPARRFYERAGWVPEPNVVTNCLGDGAFAPQMRYRRSLVAARTRASR